jgi:hypothetical protein
MPKLKASIFLFYQAIFLFMLAQAIVKKTWKFFVPIAAYQVLLQVSFFLLLRQDQISLIL